MAKIDFRKIRSEYIRRSMRYADGVRLLYDQALSDIAREFALVDYNPDTLFSFSNYGKFGRVDNIMSRLEQQIQAVVNVGIENEFGKAYAAHNDLLKQVLSDNITTELERAFAPRIASGNAAKLYISETESNNITRSMRVWNGATLGQMETAVQEALMDGMPAQQMAGLIEQYLNDPESCFRRFRIKTGVDADGMSMYGRKWMKRVRNEDGSTSWFDADPRDYPTGQGVYHSSYQNALRYTRTTTNIAYRTADYERYQTEDFVLGIEIRTTSNPTHKEDICDFLAGRYPKDFKWVGWHPQCLCFQVPILATPDEVNAMADAIMNDQDPSTVPVAGRVTDVPDNFKEWVADNQDRIQETIDKGKQLPYFLRDNGEVIDGKYIVHQFGEIAIDANAQEKANLMSAASELFNLQTDGYLPKEANLHRIVDLLEQNKLDEAEARIKTFLTAAERHVGRTTDDIRRFQDLADLRKYGQAYVDNVHKIESALGIKRGKRMTHEEANMGRVNPNWGQQGFNNNCSTCSATYILRTMGFNVQAKAKLATNPKVVTLSQGINAWDKWENGRTHYHPIKYWMRDKGYERMSPQRYMSFIKDFAKEEGVYEFVVGYRKSIGGGHSTLLRVLRDGTLEMIEQQRMTSMTLETLLKKLEREPSYVMGLFRVDNAMFNAYFSDIVEIIQ